MVASTKDNSLKPSYNQILDDIFIISSWFLVALVSVCCGLYSPTWIFDFWNLSRAVMMIVCSVFFSLVDFLRNYIIHNITLTQCLAAFILLLVTLYYSCFFCGLYSPTWIFDFRSLSRAVMMIVCSVFFSFLKVKLYYALLLLSVFRYMI